MTEKVDEEAMEQEISVVMPNGQGLQVSVKASDTGSTIKAKIYAKIGLGIPMREQVLYFRSVPLEDSRCVGESILNEKAKFYLLNSTSRSFELCFPLGHSFKCSLSEHEASESLNSILCSRIFMKFGISPIMHEVELFQDGQKLDGSKSFSELQMPEDAVLYACYYKTPMSVFISTPTGEKFEVKSSPQDTLNSFVDAIQDVTGLPLDMNVIGIKFENQILTNDKPLIYYGIHHNAVVQLFDRGPRNLLVKIPSGKTISVEFQPTATVHELIDAIHQRISVGLPIDPSYIRLSYRGRRLLSHYKLCDYGISADSSLELSFSARDSIQFVVECYTGQRVCVEAIPSDTIASVKEKLEKELCIPQEEQYLRYIKGRVLLDHLTLLDCQIHGESRLSLDIVIAITVMTSGQKMVSLKCKSMDTVMSLKRMLQEKLGFPADYQRVFCGELEMDDCAVLGDYNVTNKSSLLMKGISVNIVIASPNHDDISLEVSILETLRDVKLAACERLEIPESYVDIVRLYHEDECLADDLVVCKIEVEAKLRLGLFIEVTLPDGNPHKFWANPCDTVADIKTWINKENNIDVLNQRLMVDYLILDDEEKIGELILQEKMKLKCVQVFIAEVTFGTEQIQLPVSSRDKVIDFKKFLFEKVVKDERKTWPLMYDHLIKSGPRFFLNGAATNCVNAFACTLTQLGIVPQTKIQLGL